MPFASPPVLSSGGQLALGTDPTGTLDSRWRRVLVIPSLSIPSMGLFSRIPFSWGLLFPLLSPTPPLFQKPQGRGMRIQATKGSKQERVKEVGFFFFFCPNVPAQLKKAERNSMDGIDDGLAPWRTAKEKLQHQCGLQPRGRRHPKSCFFNKVQILEGCHWGLGRGGREAHGAKGPGLPVGRPAVTKTRSTCV